MRAPRWRWVVPVLMALPGLGFAQYGAIVLALVGVVIVLRRSGQDDRVEHGAHAVA